jgi:hypothetical protein
MGEEAQMSAESVESITDDRDVNPLVVALVAFTATDEQDMRNVALYVSRRGGVKVSMHGHDWPAVARMIDRLRLPRRPQSTAAIGRDGHMAVRFRRVDEDGRPDESLALVWFHDWL